MLGLDLCRQYFETEALPRLKNDFKEVFPRISAGLVGNGSECFGYDDETSRDHDWGIDFYIWVSEEDRALIPELTFWKRMLLEKHAPPKFKRSRTNHGAEISVMTCGDFYKSLIGTSNRPTDLVRWLRIPEENLAMAVNGSVFVDNLGEFSEVRNALLEHYPEDVRLKKIAAKCMSIAQTGQYNHIRMANRNEYVVVHIVIAKFVEQVTGLVFLLNKTYQPYYKWSQRKLRELPILGKDISDLLNELILIPGYDSQALSKQKDVIDKICAILVVELQHQRITDSNDYFLARHGESVQSKIADSLLRSLPAQFE